MSNREPLDLEALRALCDAATPGPWTVREWSVCAGLQQICSWYGYLNEHFDDKSFIAAMRNAAPAMIDEIERLRAENAELREALPASERGRSLRAELETAWKFVNEHTQSSCTNPLCDCIEAQLAVERRKVERVRVLHVKGMFVHGVEGHKSAYACAGCFVKWPCPTVVALVDKSEEELR